MSFWSTFIHQEPVQDELLESIRYQLNVLLNSEAPMRKLPDGYAEIAKSNYCFGLDSIYSISSQVDKDQFARSLEKLVRAFEPRLSDVSIVIEESDPTSNVIHFSLMAKVESGQTSHTFLFDSNISLLNQVAKMEGQEVV